MILDRYKALIVSQHLSTYCHRSGSTSIALHPKLNDVIHPLWNEIRQDPEKYYQKVFARVAASGLMIALKQANKAKPLDAVLGLILKGLAKLSKVMPVEAYDGLNFQFEETGAVNAEDEIEIEDGCQVINLEVRGCEFVL